MSDEKNDTLLIETKRIIQWMNSIRDSREEIRFRLLENFWDSQIRSKSWLINTTKKLFPELSGNVYVMGGWYGILAQLIVDNFPTKVFTIDKDPFCALQGVSLCNYDEKINFITTNMENFTNYINPQLIINTSTEHIEQNIYDQWIHNVPDGTPVILQGNNYFECYDHIRCYRNLDSFNENNSLGEILWSGKLECMKESGIYHRFMTIGYK